MKKKKKRFRLGIAQRAGDRLWSCCNWSIHSFSRPIRSLHFCYERINFQLRILSTSSIRNQYTNKNGLLDLCWCKCCIPLSQYRVPTTFPQSDLLIIIVSLNIKQWMKCLQNLAFYTRCVLAVFSTLAGRQRLLHSEDEWLQKWRWSHSYLIREVHRKELNTCVLSVFFSGAGGERGEEEGDWAGDEKCERARKTAVFSDQSGHPCDK